MKKLKLGLLVMLAVMQITGTLFAGGGKRSGTAGATELLIPVGARGISMAGASIVGSKGVESIYWNPANLPGSQNSTNVIFSHMNYFADIAVQYGAVSTSVEGLGSLALSVKSLSLGEINITTNDFPDGTGSIIKPSITVLGLTYATMLSDRVSIGLTGSFISERMDRVSANGLALNIGITYNNLANIDGFSFALVLKNLGFPMKYEGTGLNVLVNGKNSEVTSGTDLLNRQDPISVYQVDAAEFELPSAIELGFGYARKFGMIGVQANALYRNDNFYNDEVKLGAEVEFSNLLYLRGGYIVLPEGEGNYENVYNGIHAGFGIKYDIGGAVIALDYAYRTMKYWDANNIVTISLGF
ncbi:MAG: PorV/PorQ family protein [Bacteroidota bacterium]